MRIGLIDVDGHLVGHHGFFLGHGNMLVHTVVDGANALNLLVVACGKSHGKAQRE